MQLSDRINRAGESGTVKLAQQARDLRAAGVSIVELGEGEPDYDTPGFIIEAALEAARAGETRYTAVAGTIGLREAVSSKFKRDNGIEYPVDQIIVGTGAKQLIFNALLATLNAGDEVIVPAPYWVSYPDMVRIADGNPVVVECGSDSGYKIAPEALQEAITSRTRWIVLNSPGNPTGAVYSRGELEDLAAVLRANPHVAILCDDIYEKIVFDGVKFATMVEVAPDLFDRTLTVNGVSKAYAMTGWRIGYAGGPVTLISAMAKLQGQSTTNPSSVGQAAARAALEAPQGFVADWVAAYSRRRDLVHERLRSSKGLELNRPEGAFYHFIGCGGLLGRRTPEGEILESDGDVSAYLLGAGVALVPGSAFGAPGHLRLCFAKSDAELETACEIINRAIAALGV